MKEKNWEDCLFNRSAKKITPDVKIAESLIETAKERIIGNNFNFRIFKGKIILNLFPNKQITV